MAERPDRAALQALLALLRDNIVMPGDAPAAKLENTRQLGGEVITYDRYTGDREAIAREIAAERGAALITVDKIVIAPQVHHLVKRADLSDPVALQLAVFVTPDTARDLA